GRSPPLTVISIRGGRSQAGPWGWRRRRARTSSSSSGAPNTSNGSRRGRISARSTRRRWWPRSAAGIRRSAPRRASDERAGGAKMTIGEEIARRGGEEPAAAPRRLRTVAYAAGRAATGDDFGELRLDGVTRRFGGGAQPAALDSLSLTVQRGEFIALLGPSGCGKSTALNCIAGLLALSSGSIWLDERRLDILPPEQRGFGMVFQSYALFPHMTVKKNIQFGLVM